MEYRESQEFTGDLTKELAPQVQAGNQAVTSSLTQALSTIDPQLAAFVVEGLKSPATTQHAVNALIERMNDTSAFNVMNQLAPLVNNASYYAFKNPNTESDPSLIAPQKITEIARTAPTPMATAATLLEQGEVASAEMVKRLTDYGAKTQADLEQGLQNFKTALQSLDQVEVTTKGRGNAVVAVVRHPAMGQIPLMAAVGEVGPDGTWSPQIEGFGVGTPVQERLINILRQQQVSAAMQQEYGIQAVTPTYKTITPPPTQPIRPPTPTLTIEQIEANPRFQAAPPEEQAKIRKHFFEQHVATSPAISRAVAQDPTRLQSIEARYAERQAGSLVNRQAQFAGGALTGDDPYAAMAAAEGLGGATAVAQVGAAALGAQPGILQPQQEEAIREVVGNRPVAEMGGRVAGDIAAGVAMGPYLGPMAVEALRATNKAEQSDLPVYLSLSDTLMGSTPFFGTPQSQISAGAQGALRVAALNKAVPLTLGAVGLAGAGAMVGVRALGRGIRNATSKITGATPEGVKEIARDVPDTIRRFFTTGEIPAGKLREAELAAAANNTTLNFEISKGILEKVPYTRITQSGSLVVRMKNGQIVDDRSFRKDITAQLDAWRMAGPQQPAEFLENPVLKQVESIEGPIGKVNAFLAWGGSGVRAVDARIAKGLRVTRVGKEWVVTSQDFVKKFKTAKDVRAFVDSYPVPGTNIEDAALKEIASQGKNGHYLIAPVSNPDEIFGNLPTTPNWERGLKRFFSGFRPQHAVLKDVEARMGAPLFSRGVVPLEKALDVHHAAVKPFNQRIDTLMENIGPPTQGKSAGYTHLMVETPGTQAWDDLIAEYKLDPEKGLAIRQLFLDMGEAYGFDGNRLLTVVIPRVRETGSFERAFPSGNIPKEATFFADAIKGGEVPWAEGTELSIETVLRSTNSQGSWVKNAAPAWREAVQILDDLVHRPISGDPITRANAVLKRKEEHAYFEHYLRSVKGFGDPMDENLMEWMGTMTHKLSKGSGVPVHNATQLGRRVYGALYAQLYSAHFGFRPSAAAKQYLQLVQSTYPHFGEANTTIGLSKLFGKDSTAWRQRIVDSGAIPETTIMAEQEVGKLGAWLQTKSGAWVNAADKFNRFVPSSIALHLMNKYVPGYLAKAPKVLPRGPLAAAPASPPMGPPAPPPFTGPTLPPGVRTGSVAMRPIQRALATGTPSPTISAPDILEALASAAGGGTPSTGARLTALATTYTPEALTNAGFNAAQQRAMIQAGVLQRASGGVQLNKTLFEPEIERMGAGGNIPTDPRFQPRVGTAPAKPPPTITATTRMPKNYGLVSQKFQKQFPTGTEVTFDVAGTSGTRTARGTVTGYIRTKSGTEHVTVAEPGVPTGHVVSSVMGLKKARPSTTRIPRTPGSMRESIATLREDRAAFARQRAIAQEIPYTSRTGTSSKKPPALQAMDDANVEPVMRPPTPDPPPGAPGSPDPPFVAVKTPEPPGMFNPLWKQFARDTGLDHFDWQEQQQIKTLLDSGQIEEATNLAMRLHTRYTQYDYSMTGRPTILHSVAGRLGGQFATFPFNYIEQFRRIYTGGTRTWQQRTAHATRWFAANAAVKGGAAVVLGADMANYVFLQPMLYSGGPTFNWLLDWPKIMGGFSNKTVGGQITSGVGMFIPGSGMAKDVYRVTTAKDLQEAVRSGFNIPATEEEKAEGRRRPARRREKRE